MDIIFVAKTLDQGGIATSYISWANELVKYGFKVGFFVQTDSSRYLPYISDDAQVHVSQKTAMNKSARELKEYLHSHPEAIVISGVFSAIYTHKAKPESMKHWVMVHSVTVPEYHQKLFGHIRHLRALKALVLIFKMHQYKNVLLDADLCTGVSRGVLQDAQKFTKNRLQNTGVLYNPACGDRFLLAKENTDPPHPWLQTPDNLTFVSCARLEPVKDFNTSIKAFARVHQKNSAARFLILGDGPLRKDIENLIQTTFQNTEECPVELVGKVSNPEAYFAHAHAFVTASKHEAFGNVVVEALATGTQVIATDAPYGPREVLDDGKYGTLVPVGDGAALAEAMVASLEENDPQQNKENRKKRAAAFKAENLIEDFLKFKNSAKK